MIAQWLQEFRSDVRFAVRQMRRAPAFTAVAADHAGARHRRQQRHLRAGRRDAAASAAVPRARSAGHGLGAHATRTRAAACRRSTCSTGTSGTARFEAIAGFVPGVGGMVMSGADGTAETVPRQWVTAGFFDVLGVKPVAGRTFPARRRRAGRRRRGAERSVLAHAFRRRSFDRRPRPPARRGAVHRGRRRSGGSSEILGRTSIWALVSVDREHGPRAARTSCRRSDA